MNKIQTQLTQAREDYVAQNGIEPKYATVLVKYKDENTAEQEVIQILDESEENTETDSFFNDDEIFFYTQGFGGLIDLCDPNNGEDFVVVAIIDLFDEL